jgi:hypothetical protein
VTSEPAQAPTAAPKEPKTPTSEAEPGKRHPFWILWWLLAIIVLYPLSVGPVLRACNWNVPPAPVRAFYAPLEYLYDNNPQAHQAFEWYFHLWGRR